MARQPVGTLDVDAVWAAIDEQRLDVADLLDDLGRDEWEHPSLCTGWRVRDVAAHLALAHMGPGRAAFEMVRARGSLPRLIRDTAVRHAASPTEAIVAEIRGMVGSRRRAVGVSPLEPLLDVLVHGQDMAVPIGRPWAMPVDAAVTAATRIWTMPWPMSATFRTRARLRRLRLVATDAHWSAGEGEEVEGPIQALLLLMTGRTVAQDQLSGSGARRLLSARH